MQKPDGRTKTAPPGEKTEHSDSNSSSSQPKEHDGTEVEEAIYYGEHAEDDLDRHLRAFREWMVLRFKDAKFIEIAEITTGVVLVVVGIFAACIYYGQLLEMRHTNDLTQQALHGNEVTLQRTLEKMQWQIDAGRDLYGEAQKQTAQAQRLADESVEAAKAAGRQADAARDSVAAAKDAMYLEQRPWVGIEVIPEAAPGFISSPKAPISMVLIVAHNTGRTPALKWRSECCEHWDEKFMDTPVPDYDTLHNDLDRSFSDNTRARIKNGTETIEEARAYIRELQATRDKTNESRVIAPGGIEEVNNLGQSGAKDNNFHYILGKFVYRDMLDPTKEHTTKFCLMHVRSNPIELCRFGQDMN